MTAIRSFFGALGANEDDENNVLVKKWLKTAFFSSFPIKLYYSRFQISVMEFLFGYSEGKELSGWDGFSSFG